VDKLRHRAVGRRAVQKVSHPGFVNISVFFKFRKNVNSSAPKFDLRYPVAYLSAFARSFSNKLSCMYIELKSVKFVRFKCTRMYQNSQYFLKFVLDCFIIF
jgi:hypothetical protein